MSHAPESSHGGVPQPWHAPSVPVAALTDEGWNHASDAAESGGLKITPRLILRAALRYWWQIAAIWIVVSSVLVYLAYTKIKPAYDLAGYLKIDPPATGIFAQNGGGGDSSFNVELETQALQVSNPDVLGKAIKDPHVSVLPQIQNALDPIADLRKELKVMIVPKTHLLSVEMRTQNLMDAVAIINAVGQAYKDWAKNRAKLETEEQITRLSDAEKLLKKQLTEKQSEFKSHFVESEEPVSKAEPSGEERIQPEAATTITYEEFRTYLKDLAETNRNIMESKLRLDRLNAERPAALRDLEARTDDEIAADPEIAALKAKYAAASRLAARAAARTRAGNGDPIVVETNRELESIRRTYAKLKEAKAPKIQQRLRREIPIDREIVAVKEKLAALENHKQVVSAELAQLKLKRKVEMKAANKDSIDRMFAEQEMKQIDDMRTMVRRNLEQVQFDTAQAEGRIQFSPAVPSAATKVDRRPVIMATMPVLVLAIVLALFVLRELVAERVADPDDLPGRSRLGVIGVVPPLPTPRSSRALPWRNDSERTQREIQAFVQSLDHLRVALCSGRRAGAGHRCVLITSACGGEGKTTLAAQLAGRCANAGLTTLLIDADLRRPSLGTLLEVPEGPGLADVLAGEVEPEATLVIIGNAGGFHLLPAGSIVHDPSRLLQGERLGRLLDRFREAFDIVIIDTPPVLAVPDALQLGRNADGAILAVRHDSSRYSLVERARDRLQSVGVPILGAVVNGARTMENSYYHAYASPAAARDADEPTA